MHLKMGFIMANHLGCKTELVIWEYLAGDKYLAGDGYADS